MMEVQRFSKLSAATTTIYISLDLQCLALKLYMDQICQ